MKSMKKIGIIAFDIVAMSIGALLAGFGALVVWFVCMNAINGFGWNFLMLLLGVASFLVGSWMFEKYFASNKNRTNFWGD